METFELEGRKAKTSPFNPFAGMSGKKVFFDCPVHGKVEAMSFLSGGVSFCPECEDEKARAAEIEKAEKEKDRERQGREDKWKSSNVKSEFWGKDFSDFKPQTKKQGLMLDAFRAFDEGKVKKIVIMGPNGIGKSMLGSIAVMRSGGYVYSMYRIAAMIRQSYARRDAETELEIIDRLARAPVLVVDEVGRSFGTKAEFNWFSEILDIRHSEGLRFALLSNKHPASACPEGGCEDCFENSFDTDVLSRLMQDSAMIYVNDGAPDWRAGKNNHKEAVNAV